MLLNINHAIILLFLLGGSLSMGLATISSPDAELKPENCIPLKQLLYTKVLVRYCGRKEIKKIIVLKKISM
jgi:hypothetical protein